MTVFRATIFGLFALASTPSTAQTSIDDVHIAPREPHVNVAAATYPSNPAERLAAGSVIRTSADLVLVPVTITDDRYRPVVGLDQENFQLFENKKAQEIKHFSSEDAPVSVGILLDVSGSMNYKLERARDAVAQFCAAANPQDEFFLITFADSPRLVTDFTSSPEKIGNDLLTVKSSGQTSLLDAIYMGLRKLKQAHYARKALLILSDGGDNHSRYSERDVKSAIKESNVTVYSIGTYERSFSTREELLGPELLGDIADISGGHSFNLDNVNDMPEVSRAIGTQLRHQYMLAYSPQTTPRDGKWRKINVKLRMPKQLRSCFLHVEARPGYYAEAR